jgi:hypothetical protein
MPQQVCEPGMHAQSIAYVQAAPLERSDLQSLEALQDTPLLWKAACDAAIRQVPAVPAQLL